MAVSEINTDFTVNKVITDVANYVPSKSFLSNYWCILIGIIVVIGIIYFILKRKKSKHKRKINKIQRKKSKK